MMCTDNANHQYERKKEVRDVHFGFLNFITGTGEKECENKHLKSEIVFFLVIYTLGCLLNVV